MSDEKHHKLPREKNVRLNCVYCGCDYMVETNRRRQKFCSPSHSSKFYSERQIAKRLEEIDYSKDIGLSRVGTYADVFGDMRVNSFYRWCSRNGMEEIIEYFEPAMDDIRAYVQRSRAARGLSESGNAGARATV